MTFISEAHNRLLAGLAKAAPIEIPISPGSDDFDARAEHIKELQGFLVEYLHALAIDGRQNATTNAITSEVAGYVSNALSDFSAQFKEEAESLREGERASALADRAENCTYWGAP